MKVELKLVEDLCSDKVAIYSTHINDNEDSEFDKFDEFSETLENEGHKEDLSYIFETIQRVIDRGANINWFKEEGAADGMPYYDNEEDLYRVKELNGIDYGIRLYCLVLQENILIIFNGGIKTEQKAQDCPNVWPHFRHANNVAKELKKLDSKGHLDLDDNMSLHELILII